MKTTFINKLFAEYPIPYELSVYGGDNNKPAIYQLPHLIDACLDELGSDVFVVDYLHATGMSTPMPKDTISVVSAKLDANYTYQGNRMVKVTYDRGNNTAYLKYYPAIITYRRPVYYKDLDDLKGDRLRYIKAYVLWKMACRELAILKGASWATDMGTIDNSVMESFRDEMHDTYKTLKEEILIYSASN